MSQAEQPLISLLLPEGILDYFDHVEDSAESFNAKVKAFRATSGEVGDVKFFLFRLSKIYA